MLEVESTVQRSGRNGTNPCRRHFRSIGQVAALSKCPRRTATHVVMVVDRVVVDGAGSTS